jgi:curved DNA-binding protein CbpA
MTYYEELGLSPAASIDQIRHSYKTLVRLLHPDQCHDESVKRLAELQMRRLNQILAMLTDPQERGRYDARLMSPAIPPRRRADRFVSPVPPTRPWLRRTLVGLCAWGTPAVAFGSASGLDRIGAGGFGRRFHVGSGCVRCWRLRWPLVVCRRSPPNIPDGNGSSRVH